MATGLERSVLHIAAALDRLDRDWALVGGLAVAVRADPRLTRDADVAVATDDDNAAEELVASLRTDGYRVAAIVEHEPTGRLATVRLQRSSWEGIVTDLLFASCGIEGEVAAGAEMMSVTRDLRAPVARTGHLIAMKLLARDDRRRPNDADDLRALSAVATDDDWARAADAVELITERGFDRGRDLVASLAELRTEA